jgi:hypothetical protein
MPVGAVLFLFSILQRSGEPLEFGGCRARCYGALLVV